MRCGRDRPGQRRPGAAAARRNDRGGRRRRFDDIFIERRCRTVKYEEVYLKDYEDGRSAARSLGTYFGLYNRERLHESLGYRVPEEAHFEKSARRAPEFSCAARSLAVG